MLYRQKPAACGLVADKCMYQSLLLKLRQDQHNGYPGTLGPVKAFKGVSFFDQFASLSPGVRGVLEGPAWLRGYGDYYVAGDFHGDLMVGLAVLHLAGLIDDQANWIPPVSDTHPRRCFVQLGDMVDRGGRGDISVDTSHMPREELNLLEYMYEIDLQAQKHGERVISVSGNHELYAVRTAFDDKLASRWNFTSKATACPFPSESISRKDVFRRPGALRYFAFIRPPLALSSSNWLFCHGDVPIGPLRKFLVTHKVMIGRLRARTRVPYAACVVGATNLLWANYLLLLGGDRYMFERIKAAIPAEDNANSLSEFPLAVCTCRTLVQMNGVNKPCDCTGQVDAIADELGLDWTVSGGVALGHTVQTAISTRCMGRVQLLDLGMSEAFRKYNPNHKIGILHIQCQQHLISHMKSTPK